MSEGNPTTPEAAVPAWKFWHPLPFWHVLVIFFIAQIVAAMPVVFVREALGIGLPTATIGGAGGLVGYFIVMRRAQKARETAPAVKG
ncbi:MAG: hypothetical protein R3B13_22040 [Polyangiaceae bacterium]